LIKPAKPTKRYLAFYDTGAAFQGGSFFALFGLIATKWRDCYTLRRDCYNNGAYATPKICTYQKKAVLLQPISV